MKQIDHLRRGMGIGGWLTNYKRFNVLPPERRMVITVGDMEHFEGYITEQDIAYIASLGFDHVRLGFDQIVLEEAPYRYRASIFDILHRFTNWCHKYDLGIVLNMHKALGNYCDILEEKGLMEDGALQARLIALWLKIEQEFSNDGDVVFELLNEVVNATPEEWNALADRLICAIRAQNATRKIVVGGTDWGNPPALSKLRIWEDKNVIYTFHCYAPHEFTHQRGVLQAAQLFYNREMPYPCEDIERYRDFQRVVNGEQNSYSEFLCMDIDFLRAYLAPVKAWIDANPDKILWCGEFGTIRHAKLQWRENWMRDMITLLKEMDIPYCVWNYLSTPNDGNRFSLVDDDNRRILSTELHKILLGEIQ